MEAQQHDGRSTAQWLGYLGLIPFVAGAVLVLTGDPASRDLAIRAVIAYGAVIVSFVGAIHWGIALNAAHARAGTLYVVSVLPSLVAWLALLFTPPTGLVLLIAAFVLLWLYERATLWSNVFPGWFATLRTRLTAVAASILALLLMFVPRG